MAETKKSPQKLHIGVLVLGNVQYMDAAPADLFAFLDRKFMQQLKLRPDVIEYGVPDFKIEWLTEQTYLETTAGAHKDGPVRALPTSSRAKIVMDHVIPKDAADADMPLYDVVIVPGPDPDLTVTDAVKRFLWKHYRAQGSDILAVCTGNEPLAYAGIYDGKTATATRPLIPMFLRDWFPKVNWEYNKRWLMVEEGLWSAGGVLSGIDMVMAYMEHKYPKQLVDVARHIAEVHTRPQEYPDDGSPEYDLFAHDPKPA